MFKRMFVLISCLMLYLSVGSLMNNAAAATPGTQEALRIADFILSLQDAEGAIRDTPEVSVINEDSNMEYALMGVAAAYAYSKNPKYLSSLERGIQWLAAREVMNDTKWRGSWFYTYSATPPYAPVATSPGQGVSDVRGVDSTSALFVYLLYLHKTVTGSDKLAKLYKANALAALDFMLTANRAKDGFFYSSWQKRSGKWKLWRYQYTADQADDYLGLQAGHLLYDGPDQRYGQAAAVLRNNLPAAFFNSSLGRWSEGRDVDGSLDDSNEFAMVFPQGYVPWVFGLSTENLLAYDWLARGVQSDGRLKLFRGDPGYSLAVSIFGLAAETLGIAVPQQSFNWLLANTYDPKDGSVRDELDLDSDKYSNVAGFTILALLRQRAW